MNRVTILTGCAGAGKTERLLAEYRSALEQSRRERRPGTALWLAPNRRIERETKRRIAAHGTAACFAPNVLTFDQFAEQILQSAGQPASRLSPVMRRLLMRRVVETRMRRDELRHFRSIAGAPGFLDVVSRFISELKREEIWPHDFVAVCRQRTSDSARRDLELGMIYEDYQAQLTRQNWYDNEGLFWLARSAIEGGARRPFEDVKLLVVDGFADFTKTQYEILGHMTRWIEQALISLPVESSLSRPELFAKPHAAIEKIRKQLPPEISFSIERLSSNEALKINAGCPWTKTCHTISGQLFSNARRTLKSDSAPGLEFIQAKGPLGEWQAVARRIKRLLSGHDQLTQFTEPGSFATTTARPRDIVIGLRSIADEGPRLRDYLHSTGLPVWCESESPMSSRPMVKAVVSLLHLELDDWPFEQLLSVLDSNYFQPAWPECQQGRAVRSVAAILRKKQIHQDRELILKIVSGLALEPTNKSQSQQNSLREWARQAAPLLTRLSRALDRFRRSHTLFGWADALGALAEELGWTKPKGTDSDRLTLAEWQDLDLLQRNLRTAAEADQKFDQDGEERLLDLTQFTAELCDMVNHEAGISSPEPDGCVKILSVEQVRNLDVPHLFLIGLTENSFPMNQSDDCLLSEAERQDFNDRGIPLRHRSSQSADEMLLFYSVVTRARRSLTLSYPAVNLKGQPLYPSPYLSALRELFEPAAVTVSIEGQLSPVPLPGEALTITDLRLAAVDEARKGQPGLFRKLLETEPLQRTLWNTLAACDVAHHRFRERGFTNYEGQLRLPQNIESLKQRFGAAHQFSATELESYAKCPFQFWLSTVLRIGSVETPEEGTDYASRGNLLHEALARLLREGLLSEPERLKPRFLELIDELLNRDLPETQFQKSLIDIERQILAEWVDAFVDQQSEYDSRIRELFSPRGSLPPEIPFGRLPDVLEQGAEALPSIQFGSDENAVQVRGRIDRVDVGSADGRPAYIVIDYKSGRRPSGKPSDLVSGRTMQLGLYLLAIKRLGLIEGDAVPFQMGYWALRETGFKQEFGGTKLKQVEPADILWLETLFDHLLPQLASEIREGRFIVENEDETCTGRCPYRTVCRVNQLRPLAELLQKQSAPRIDPSKTGPDS